MTSGDWSAISAKCSSLSWCRRVPGIVRRRHGFPPYDGRNAYHLATRERQVEDGRIDISFLYRTGLRRGVFENGGVDVGVECSEHLVLWLFGLAQAESRGNDKSIKR